VSPSWPHCIYSLPLTGFPLTYLPPFRYHHAAPEVFNKANPKANPKPQPIAADEWFCPWQAITEPGHPSPAFLRIDSPDGRDRVLRV